MRVIVVLVVVIAAGCASKPTYLENLAAMPAPSTEAERNASCSTIRSEIARMQNVGMMATPGIGGMAVIVTARKNIAALESKAAEFRCSSAFAERNQPQASAIDQCIAACLANTGMTSAECFAECK